MVIRIISPRRPVRSLMSVTRASAVMRSPALTGWKNSQSLPASSSRSKGMSKGIMGLTARMDLRNVGGAINVP